MRLQGFVTRRALTGAYDLTVAPSLRNNGMHQMVGSYGENVISSEYHAVEINNRLLFSLV